MLLVQNSFIQKVKGMDKLLFLDILNHGLDMLIWLCLYLHCGGECMLLCFVLVCFCHQRVMIVVFRFSS